jgi:hypothetical protein
MWRALMWRGSNYACKKIFGIFQYNIYTCTQTRHVMYVWHESSTYTIRHNMIILFWYLSNCPIAQGNDPRGKVRYGEVSSRLGVFSGFFLGGAFYLLAWLAFIRKLGYGEATSKLGGGFSGFSSISFLAQLASCYATTTDDGFKS